MIIVFPKHPPGGSGRRAINYLVNKQDRQIEAEVLRGDPEQTARLIDSLEFRHKYTFGICSFAPGETVAPEVEQKIMDRFESAAFAGLERDQYDILWVRHTDKGHHELHFVVPRVELSSGKSLNICPPGSNAYFNALGDSINFEYGFADPRASTRQREHRLPHHAEKLRAETQRMLGVSRVAPSEVLHERLCAYALENRERCITRTDLIAYLEAEGLEVPRVGDRYITVKLPDLDLRWRLRGAMYEKGWDSSKLRDLERDDTIRTGAQPEKARLAMAALTEMSEKRAEYNQGRYGREFTDRELERQLAHQVLLSRLVRAMPSVHEAAQQDDRLRLNHLARKNLLLMKSIDAEVACSDARASRGVADGEHLASLNAARCRAEQSIRSFLHPPNAEEHARGLAGERLVDIVGEADSRNQARQLIDKHLEACLGHAPDRDAVVKTLEQEGFRITRSGKDYLTVQDPARGDRWRLTGPMYEAWGRSRTTCDDGRPLEPDNHRRTSRGEIHGQHLKERLGAELLSLMTASDDLGARMGNLHLSGQALDRAPSFRWTAAGMAPLVEYDRVDESRSRKKRKKKWVERERG
ncbi:MAG: relaxase/mobilization nuclease domain-containing protein [Pseudomonadota bacterium]